MLQRRGHHLSLSCVQAGQRFSQSFSQFSGFNFGGRFRRSVIRQGILSFLFERRERRHRAKAEIGQVVHFASIVP